jgi:hypothetical protein
MIKQKFYELFEKYYYNGSPAQKARIDIVVMFGCAILGSLIVVAIMHFGFWFELCISLICYGVFNMVMILYRSRIDHYEYQEKFNKKG